MEKRQAEAGYGWLYLDVRYRHMLEGNLKTYIEPISAMEVLTAKNASQTMRNIQIMPPVPPSVRPIAATSSEVSQEAMRIMENPNIETRPKFRYIHMRSC